MTDISKAIEAAIIELKRVPHISNPNAVAALVLDASRRLEEVLASSGQGAEERGRSVMDVIWCIAKALKGWDGSPENAGDRIIEAAKALQDFGYWQGKLPAAPASEKGEAKE